MVAEAEVSTVRCGPKNYLLAHLLLARYWQLQQLESLEWLLHAMGRDPAPVHIMCQKCKQPSIHCHRLLDTYICENCLAEFLAAREALKNPDGST